MTVHFWALKKSSLKCSPSLVPRRLQWKGCRHCSVDLSAYSILQPQVRVPSTPSTLFYIWIAERTKIKTKRGRDWPFFKKWLHWSRPAQNTSDCAGIVNYNFSAVRHNTLPLCQQLYLHQGLCAPTVNTISSLIYFAFPRIFLLFDWLEGIIFPMITMIVG